MTIFHDVNRDTLNANGECLFQIQQTLVAAGWIVKGSSDAVTYKSTDGSQITQAGTGANGFNILKAWIRIQDPSGLREFIFQRGSAATSIRVKYSAAAKFTGGAPAALVTPSATDEQYICGGGTDAAPTYSVIYPNTAGSYRHHVVAESTAHGGVYGFWAWTVDATVAVAGGIYCEPLDTTSYPGADTDPCIIGGMTDQSSSIYKASIGSRTFGWYKFGLAGVTWVAYNPYEPVHSGLGTFHFGSAAAGGNPYNGDHVAIPRAFGRPTTLSQPGWKGFSKFTLLRGQANSFPAVVLIGGNTKVYVDHMLVPWPTGITPLI